MALITPTRHRATGFCFVLLALTTCCLGGSKKARQQITQQPRMKDKTRKRGMRHMGPLSFGALGEGPADLPPEDLPPIQLPHDRGRGHLEERFLERAAQDVISAIEQRRDAEFIMARVAACRIFYEMYEETHPERTASPLPLDDKRPELRHLDLRHRATNIDRTIELLIGRDRETRNVRLVMTVFHDPA